MRAIVIGLKKSIKKILKLHICHILPRILLDQDNTRLNPYLNQEDFQLATFLDPRFIAEWLQTDEEKALFKEASIQLTKELLKIKAAIKVSIAANDLLVPTTIRIAARPTPKKKRWLTHACSLLCR